MSDIDITMKEMMMTTIDHAMTLLVAELTEGEVPAPLTQSFTLASVWADLARLADEPLPGAVAAIVGAGLEVVVEPVPSAARWLALD